MKIVFITHQFYIILTIKMNTCANAQSKKCKFMNTGSFKSEMIFSIIF